MKKTLAERQAFFLQEKLPLEGFAENDKIRAYRLAESGQVIFEVSLDLGLPEEKEIAFVADMHINLCNAEDDLDPEIAYTKTCRHWNEGGLSVPAADLAMDAAEYADQTVVGGDTLDYLSRGAIEAMRTHVFARDPYLLCCVGGHDYTKEMQTGRKDLLPFEEREAILSSFWCHDLHFAVRRVGGVVCAALDNGTTHYYPGTAERLASLIAAARKSGEKILVFQHEPIATGKPADRDLDTFIGDYRPIRNFYDSAEIIGSPEKKNSAEDSAVLALLKSSTDVVAAIFAGHYHGVYYTEVEADGGKVLPQYLTTSNCYFGYHGALMRILLH